MIFFKRKSVFIKSIFGLASFCVLVSCQPNNIKSTQNKYKNELIWLRNANPQKDFEKSVKKKDFRFRGIYGYSLNVPGIKGKCLNYHTDVNPIKGTGDVIYGKEHGSLIALAKKYAKSYNLKMKEYRIRNQGFTCQ